MGGGWQLAAETQDGLESRHRSTAAIESKGVLVEVGRQVFVTDPMVSTTEPGLKVSEDVMDVRQNLLGARRMALHGSFVLEAPSAQRQIALPSVRVDSCAAVDVALDKAAQRGARCIGHHLEPDSAELPAFSLRISMPELDGSNDECLGEELASAAQTGLSTSDVGLIDLDTFMQAFPIRPDHDTSEFVQHCPGRLVATQSQLTLQLKRGESRRMGRYKIGGPEPRRKPKLGPVKHRACGHRRIAFAGLAAPQVSGRKLEGLQATADRAHEPIRPARGSQIRSTSLLGPETTLKLDQIPRKVRPRHLRPLHVGGRGDNRITIRPHYSGLRKDLWVKEEAPGPRGGEYGM